MTLLPLLGCRSQQREKEAQEESCTACPIHPPSPSPWFSDNGLFSHEHMDGHSITVSQTRCSSEFTGVEPRSIAITHILLVSKIMLEITTVQKKYILNLVTSHRTNRNVHPALNKNREKDLYRRKNFNILSI